MTDTFSPDDIRWMQHAIHLASLAEGFTAPNPCVGAVLIHNNEMIGSGWHRHHGGPHAEVNCLRSVAAEHRQRIAESTMYVTLEPCAHFGKTPPCAQLLVAEKIKRVVIACRDPFDKVNGRGIDILREAGIAVRMGLLQQEAIHLNRHFFTLHTKSRPYICLKYAQTNDGFIGSGSEQRLMISNEWSNRWVHSLRGKYQAILIGVETANRDNPLLDARFAPQAKAPLPIIFDPQGRIDLSLRLFKTGRKVIIMTSNEAFKSAYQKVEHVDIVLLNREEFLEQAMQELARRQILSILVEGGARTLQHFIQASLWEEAYVITNTVLQISDGLQAPSLGTARHFDTFEFNSDQINHWVAHDNEFHI